MMRLIRVIVGSEHAESVRNFLTEGLSKLGIIISHMTVETGPSETTFNIRKSVFEIEPILLELQKFGIGRLWGVIDVLPLSITFPVLEKMEMTGQKKSGIAAVTERMSSEEIYAEIKKGASLDFTFWLYLVVAATVASFGLLTNSVVSLVASMILGPIMGPILASSYGWVTHDKELRDDGLKGQAMGFTTLIGIGLVVGLVTAIQIIPLDTPILDNTEILSRGVVTPLWVVSMVIIAFVSGIAVGFIFTRGLDSSVVGIAIAASFVPPAVNVGLCLSIGLVQYNLGMNHDAMLMFSLSLGSLFLLATNIAIINITAFLVFKLKRVDIGKRGKHWGLYVPPQAKASEAKEPVPAVQVAPVPVESEKKRRFGRGRGLFSLRSGRDKKSPETPATKVISEETPVVVLPTAKIDPITPETPENGSKVKTTAAVPAVTPIPADTVQTPAKTSKQIKSSQLIVDDNQVSEIPPEEFE